MKKEKQLAFSTAASCMHSFLFINLDRLIRIQIKQHNLQFLVITLMQMHKCQCFSYVETIKTKL